MLVFRKQVDNLKTNHRVRERSPENIPGHAAPFFPLLERKDADTQIVVQGVYVLTDNLFRPFSRMSTAMGENAVPRAEPVRPFFLYHPEFCRKRSNPPAIVWLIL